MPPSSSKGWPGWSVYRATKAALRSFAPTWSADLEDHRIRVNAISPGVIETPGLTELLRPTKQNIETPSDGVPLGRIGTPDEIAEAVVFLATDDSSYVTGAEFFVDGGVAQV
jgi:NAD(P)-dependent dehydrogenase (short-subunit alcohol dehydrogenase family)